MYQNVFQILVVDGKWETIFFNGNDHKNKILLNQTLLLKRYFLQYNQLLRQLSGDKLNFQMRNI